MAQNTIYIQIASYRDPELVPTIKNCLEQADNPDNLVFGICWQRDETEELPYFSDKRFRIMDVHYSESKGVCWARNQVQRMYMDEDYTLQLDSHHRFTKGWDTTLITMLKDLQEKGHDKPLLTSYIPSYDPENDPTSRVQQAWEMTFDRFIPEGAVFFLPREIPGWRDLTEPKPARFYSAHFAFTVGKFAREVQHDPEYYFHGEEISIAVRAFTHGYDLFHPHKIIAWHEYTRKGRTKCWDDDKTWGDRNSKSHNKNRCLFGMDGQDMDEDDRYGEYGFGRIRTLRDYEKYSGLHFGKRAVQQYTLDHKYPHNPVIEDEQEWEDSFTTVFKHCIDVGFASVPEEDYDFWCVAFKDTEGNDVYRKDADSAEIQRMKTDPDGYCKVWREFQTDSKPASWLVWPHSLSKGWCGQLTGTL
jgi:hypothetical protein